MTLTERERARERERKGARERECERERARVLFQHAYHRTLTLVYTFYGALTASGRSQRIITHTLSPLSHTHLHTHAPYPDPLIEYQYK